MTEKEQHETLPSCGLLMNLKPHPVIILLKLMGAGPGDVITCGMVIPPETIISVESW
jgi:hypothetical protein